MEVVNDWLATPADNGALLAMVAALSFIIAWRKK